LLFHHLIRDALAAGDPARAAGLMSEHIFQGRDVLLAAVRQYPSLDALIEDAGGPDQGASGGIRAPV
jgi:hypothetical protein